MREVDANRSPRAAALVVALLVAIFAFQLNASMLSPALATMQQELDATTAEIGLTQTAFFTAAALLSLVLPRWGDLIGRRRVMLGMLAVTALGCLIAALASNVITLFLGRVVQGAAGPIVPMALIMLRVQMPDPKRYATWMAVLTSVNGGIAGFDALLGGWLAAHYGFRSIFWTMAVVCVVALAAITVGTIESTSRETLPMDWKGAVPLVLSLGTVLTAFNETGKLGEANWPLVAALIAAGIVAFLVFWRVEASSPHPLVSTTYMKQRRTWALLLTTTLTMTGVFAVMNGLVPNLAQDPQFMDIAADTVSWYTLTPYAVAGLLMGPVAGYLAAGLGYRVVLQAGLLGTTIVLGVTALTIPHATPLMLLLLSVFVGITYAGTSNIMLNGLGVVLSPEDNQGYLPGMNSSAFNLGTGLSFAILFAMTTLFSTSGNAAVGYQAGMLTGMGILVLALVASFLIPRSDSQEVTEDSTAAPSTTRESP